MTTQALQASRPTVVRSALLGALISLVTLIGGLLLGLVFGTLGHAMLPGATLDPLPLIGGIIPALGCFMLDSGLWGMRMGRLTGNRNTKRLALASLLGFAPITIVLALLLALLAACGAPANEPTITMKDMRFRQTEVHVKAGQPVTLRLVNEDGYAHAFDMDAFDIHTPLAANEVREFTITPEQPGRYDFYCGAPGHQSAGMVGVLIVEP